ncbi:hypothetical protein P355_1184 [Burkholderia cenocepacia KC-01]|nr:hypothetical protein P355_1184 [Burkholderia cenocepacia KC-01]
MNRGQNQDVRRALALRAGAHNHPLKHTCQAPARRPNDRLGRCAANGGRAR